MTDLRVAPWTRRDDLATLVAAIGAEEMRWVGGAVRDTLLGLPVSDIDAATRLRPDAVIAACARAGLRTVPTGIDHGTVTVLLPHGDVEVTTLRRDVSTDGRRATVAFAKRWEEDARRRDFTINALFAHPETLAIDDHVGGLADLAARRVRFIGDARERIAEDRLRILRYYRFQARFGTELDAEAEAACAELAPTMTALSAERIATELLALLALPAPCATVAKMAEHGVLAIVLPEAGPAGIERLRHLIAQERSEGVPPDPLRRFAALLPPDVARAEAAATRLRLSNAQRDRLAKAAGRNDSDRTDVRALAYHDGLEAARDRLLLAGASIDDLRGWSSPELPLKGGEIVARGIAPGPEVSRILRTVEARWIAEGFPGRDRVLALLDEHLARS